MGWQGSMMTAGSALSPPLVGWMIDSRSWQAGFVAAGAVGLVLCLVLIVADGVRRRSTVA